MIQGASPKLKARVAGVFYAVTVVTSLFGYFAARGTPVGHVSNLFAGAAYVVVTVILYDLFKPVNRNVSVLAAFFSLEGIAHTNDSLFFFGFYCIALGYLIYRSGYFPRALGVVMALAGLGLLVNDLTAQLSPALHRAISPIGFTLDGIGEILFTLWLLVIGLDAAGWKRAAEQQRSAASQ